MCVYVRICIIIIRILCVDDHRKNMEFWIYTVATVYRNNIIVKQEILRNEAKLLSTYMT